MVRKKRKMTKKKNQTSVVYLIALIFILVLMLGLFQLGLFGQFIDYSMIYIAGSARYFTYVIAFLMVLYYAVNKKYLPMSRRVTGWLLLQVTLCMLLAGIFYMMGHTSVRTFNQIFEIETHPGMHFQGGGVVGFYFYSILAKLISTVGAFVFITILMTISILLIMNRSIRRSSKELFDYLETKFEKKQSKPKRNKMNKDLNEIKDVSDFVEVKPDDGLVENDEIEETSIPVDEHKQVKNEEIDDLDDAPVVYLDDQQRDYQLPPIDLLDAPKNNVKQDTRFVKKRGQLLEATLKNFGVNVKVNQIKIGPSVTQYEVQPAVGVKVNRIVNLSNDLALALAAKDIRIEAPIPGKSAVGIEVPNTTTTMVTLREVISEVPKSAGKLTVALGRDIEGDPIFTTLNELPHLLVAGATGSGKSVCINGIITSILMNALPSDVKLLMIDPKMVELSVYNGIPHLLSPVVTNPQKAAQSLQKIVGEMERRYDIFSHVGVRNIEGYNNYLNRQNLELGEKNALMPYTVVIIDELADLMMVASKDVETAIMRLTQMGRASGIHLIVATQRPSVDVITGLIKANIPSRIAFSVSSQIDSRTILGMQGAEKLLGRGDMLYLPSDESKPIRIQGAFLSDKEVESVVDFVTKQQSANYDNTMEVTDADLEVTSEDDLYGEAMQFVITSKKASASLLQRQFRIGYNRAARLIDDLERNNIVGPQAGSKPRKVLITEDELED